MVERVPAGGRLSVERDVFPAVAAEGRLFALCTEDYWIDTGRPDLYRQANLDAVSGARRTVHEPDLGVGTQVDGDVERCVLRCRGAGRLRGRSAVERAPVAVFASMRMPSWWTRCSDRTLTCGRAPASIDVVLGRGAVVEAGERLSKALPACPGMRSLVVGGAGFLGSHVVDRLLAEGHTVDVVDDLSTGSLGNLAEARAEHVGSLKFHNLDVRVAELGDLLARLRPDVAVHLAVPATGSGPSLLSTALGGTANLLDAAGRGRYDEGRGRAGRRGLLRPRPAAGAAGQGGHPRRGALRRHDRPAAPWPTCSRSTGIVTRSSSPRWRSATSTDRGSDPVGGGGGLPRRPPLRGARR